MCLGAAGQARGARVVFGAACAKYGACGILTSRRRRLRGPKAWDRARRRRLSSPKRLPGHRAQWKIDLVKKQIPKRRLRPLCVPIKECLIGKGRPAKVAPKKAPVDLASACNKAPAAPKVAGPAAPVAKKAPFSFMKAPAAPPPPSSAADAAALPALQGLRQG